MTATQPQTVERPIAAFVLTLLAGLWLLGRSGMMYRWGHEAWRGPMHGWMEPWAPGAFLGIGWPWLGIVAGVILLVAAVALHVRPEARRQWGIVILVTSGLHLLLGMGGFLADILGLVAGGLALLGGRVNRVSGG
jgi:hypothetical protein